MTYLLLFLGGALLCNGIPHLAAGLRGEPFPTPFAKPPGEGLTSPPGNFLWGSANVFGGVALITWRMPTSDLWPALGVVALGWLAIGSYLAVHFAKVRSKR